MKMDKIQTGIRFEKEMLDKMTIISKYNRRSLTAQVEYLAQGCIDEYEKEHGEIILNDER